MMKATDGSTMIWNKPTVKPHKKSTNNSKVIMETLENMKGASKVSLSFINNTKVRQM